MSSKARRDRLGPRMRTNAPLPWTVLVQACVLGGCVAVMVSAALIPSESAISDGTYAPLAALACVLLLSWCAASWLGRQTRLVLGWTEIAGAALIAWHCLAAIVSLGHVNGRQALNALWLLVGYGATAFLFRQGLRFAADVRALAVVMLWLATLLSSLGFYQYFYSMPLLRQQYEANPEQVLTENGYPTDKNSPQRTLLENRLRSVEPLATFALTNSLAGFLAPWLIASLAIGLNLVGDAGNRRSLVAVTIIAVVLAGCLALTKSRTAYLASLVGILLVALYGRRSGWRLDWRIPTISAGVLIVISLAAVALGGIDVQVLSEAPKSVLYRLEYWQATSALIAAHPVFGAGPGNFQAAYAAYKLPQASEMIADPHNFLLEMWATAGTPGIVLLVLLLAAVVADLHSQLATAAPTAPATDGTRSEPATLLGTRAIFAGAAAGLSMALPLALLVGYVDALSASILGLPAIWLFGFPLLAACWWSFEPWMTHGRLTLATAVIALVVLLLNLLAAGAIVFPGVIGTLLALLPVALCVARQPLAGSTESASEATNQKVVPASRLQLLLSYFPRDLRLSSLGAGLFTVAAASLAVACLRTEYHPNLNCQLALRQAQDALRSGDPKAAEAFAVAAAAADHLSPEPWRQLAEIRFARWQAAPADDAWQAFTQAAGEFQRRDPTHHLTHYTCGNWYLAAWRRQNRQADLSEAVASYSLACMFYPNRALYHAQLGWTLHLGGEESLAAQEADQAKSLDDRMPHQEQKLSRQQVFDPEFANVAGGRTSPPSAEQIVNQLRTTDKEKSP